MPPTKYIPDIGPIQRWILRHFLGKGVEGAKAALKGWSKIWLLFLSAKTISEYTKSAEAIKLITDPNALQALRLQAIAQIPKLRAIAAVSVVGGGIALVTLLPSRTGGELPHGLVDQIELERARQSASPARQSAAPHPPASDEKEIWVGTISIKHIVYGWNRCSTKADLPPDYPEDWKPKWTCVLRKSGTCDSDYSWCFGTNWAPLGPISYTGPIRLEWYLDGGRPMPYSIRSYATLDKGARLEGDLAQFQMKEVVEIHESDILDLEHVDNCLHEWVSSSCEFKSREYVNDVDSGGHWETKASLRFAGNSFVREIYTKSVHRIKGEPTVIHNEMTEVISAQRVDGR